MTTMMPTICSSCKHLKDGKCPAFPTGIPEDYLIWGADHRSVVEGQEGTTVWALLDGAEQQFEDWMFAFVLTPE